MRVAVHDYVTAIFPGFLKDLTVIPGNAVQVSVGHVDPVFPEFHDFGNLKVCKEVIIPPYECAGASRHLADDLLMPLHIPTVDQVIRLTDLFQDPLEIVLVTMCITDDQYSHNISPSFARISLSALPRWLIAFFSEGDSSADVQPFSGT